MGVCVCVCVRVCVRACMRACTPIAMAWSSSGSIAVHYVVSFRGWFVMFEHNGQNLWKRHILQGNQQGQHIFDTEPPGTAADQLSMIAWLYLRFLTYVVVVWPTTSCSADWSKHRHMIFSIIDWPTLHDNLSSDIFTLRENVRWLSSDIFTLRESVRWSDSLDGISTYSNADVVCYSATCRTGLNERNSVRQIVDRSYK